MHTTLPQINLNPNLILNINLTLNLNIDLSLNLNQNLTEIYGHEIHASILNINVQLTMALMGFCTEPFVE